jgi:transcriptional regulator with XRE-family HTH domain
MGWIVPHAADPHVTTAQRDELARFLRSRRDRVRPEDVGFPRGPRRRLPGLRREEVALLAGVSSTWYTYLEQGRPGVHPSQEVLDSLARVLRLDEDETRFLHRLADKAAAVQPLDAVLTPAQLATLLVRQGETDPYPLYAVDGYCDLIEWNQAATTYYTDFGELPTERPNMMWWLIATAEAKERLADWEIDTRDVVARWRKVAAFVADSERLEAQVVEYRRISPQFGAWWDSHDVREHHTKLRRFRHPQRGPITLRLIVVASPEMAPHHNVIYHVPAELEPRPTRHA